MGKSSGKKKKVNVASGEGSTKLDPDDALFLRRAHELKDEGNRRFQAKDYLGAMDIYEQALKLTPEGHPDRAVFHSNRAACLLQVKPVTFENVVLECTLALEAHPKFGKALFRRARAYEAMGKLQLALSDVQLLLQSESNNQDALELTKRLRLALGNTEEAQQDTQWRSSVSLSTSPPDTGSSPATPGADGAPGQGGRGPSLPVRPVGAKKGHFDSELTLRTTKEGDSTMSSAAPNASQAKMVKGSSNQGKGLGNLVVSNDGKVAQKKGDPGALSKPAVRQLKLIFGHDIRRAEIPVNSGFGQLREMVRKRFPALKAALIKYEDLEGDLVTITSREELRLAESEIEAAERAKRRAVVEAPLSDSSPGTRSVDKLPVQCTSSSLELLRLHIVEVSPEQEPPVPEDDLMVTPDDVVEEDETAEEVNARTGESLGENVPVSSENGQLLEAKPNKPVKKEDGQPTGEEMEIDDWLFDFAQLFRTHVGIDPDGHVDFHEVGMELCSEALEAAVTSEEAQPLFEAAAAKFQEVAALALFNWGNVYMCAARKRMPLEEAGGKTESKEQLQAAFDWAQRHYKLAGFKYEEALKIKPDFYEGVLALGQEKFESAKLQWAAAVTGEVDLKTWDSTETLNLYRFAEERMQTAAEMWEQLEAQQQGAQVETIPKARKEQSKAEPAGPEEAAGSAEALEQGAAMRSQINLFWGNVLFEHSQVEFRLGLPSWKALLDTAVEKFVAAGAATEEIEGALKNHPSNLLKEKAAVSASINPTLSSDSRRKVDSNGDVGSIVDDVSKQDSLAEVEEETKGNSVIVSSDMEKTGEGTGGVCSLEAASLSERSNVDVAEEDKSLKKNGEGIIEDKSFLKGSDKKKAQGR